MQEVYGQLFSGELTAPQRNIETTTSFILSLMV